MYDPSPNKFVKYDSSSSKSKNITGICVVRLSGTLALVLLDGHVVVADEVVGFASVIGQTASNIGEPIYGAQGVTGKMSITSPTATGQVVRRFGQTYKINNDGTLFLMLFRPSNDYNVI